MTDAAAQWNAKHPNSASPDPVTVKYWPQLHNARHWLQTKTTSAAFMKDGRAFIKVAISKQPVPLENIMEWEEAATKAAAEAYAARANKH